MYFDILVVFRILILKFSRIRSQVHEAQGACCPDHDDEVCQGDRDFPSRGLGGGAAQGPTAPEGEEKREGGGGQESPAAADKPVAKDPAIIGQD